MIDRDLANRVVEFMDELVKIDSVAVSTLCGFRTPCNEQLQNHPTVQVSKYKPDEPASVGLLGILNGLCGVADDGYGAIAAIVDTDTGVVSGFQLIR